MSWSLTTHDLDGLWNYFNMAIWKTKEKRNSEQVGVKKKKGRQSVLKTNESGFAVNGSTVLDY